MSLIPTPRTDVNGKTTTRHMKPVGTSSNTASIAAPAAASNIKPLTKHELDDYVWDLSDRLEFTMEEATTTLLYANLEYLSKASPDLFVALNTRLDNADEYERAHWSRCLQRAQFHPMGPDEEDFDFRAVFGRHLETIPFTRELWAVKSEDPEDWAMEAYSFCHEALRPVLRHVDADDYSMMKASILATWAVRGPSGNFTPPDYRKDYDNLIYMADHLDEAFRVRDELLKRNTIARDVVEALSSSASTTLMEGAL